MEALRRLTIHLALRGFDLVIPFRVAEVLRKLCEAGVPLVEAFEGPGNESWEGLLIGNSRALWAPFERALRETELSRCKNPLDTYTEETLTGALSGWPDARVHFAHGDQGRKLPIQRIADATERLRLGPGFLNVHPEFGPWIALRGVVVFRQPGTLEAQTSASAPHPCSGCSAPCAAALTRALEGLEPASLPAFDHLDLPGRARAFLAVRAACPVGWEQRYGDEQIAYHYRAALGIVPPWLKSRDCDPKPPRT